MINTRTNVAIASTMKTGIAYIMSRFPKLTETFILREMLELDRGGQPIIILPLLRAKESVFHAEVNQLMPKVIFTPFISTKIVSANLHFLRHYPGKYFKVLWTALRGNWGSANLFIGALGIFPKSVFFARLVEEKCIRHVHAHYSTHPALSALIISELTGVSFSFTAHAHDIFVHTRMLDHKFEKAKFVVTISEFNKQYILRLFPETLPEKIKVIHCGVDLDKYHPPYLSQASSVINYPVQNKRDSSGICEFSIFCVASLQPYKGIDYLIKACAFLKTSLTNFRCLIVGEGKERNKIEHLIFKLNLSEEINLLGGQTQERIAAFLRDTNLYVCPSIVANNGQMEGIPVAIMEAMASGLPVVSTNISGIPELVEDGVTGLLVSPRDEHALADAIVKLNRNETLRKDMGKRGRERVATEFEIKTNVEKLSYLFSNIDNPKSVMTNWEAEIKKNIAEIFSKHFPDHTSYEDVTYTSLYRIGSGHDSEVYEVTAQNSQRNLPKLILKLHKNTGKYSDNCIELARNNSYREYKSLLLLWKEFTLRTNRFLVPRPFDHFQEFAAILMEKCQGIRFDQSLRWARFLTTKYQKSRISQNARACGEWLAMFHGITEKLGDPATIYQRIEREFLDDLKNCFEIGLSRKLVDGVARIFEEKKSLAFNSNHTIVGHHCDFGPYNVFISSDEVTVIDFEGLRDGIIYDDICYFLAMIYLIPSYHVSPGLRQKMKECFLEGYSNYEKIEQEEFDLFMLTNMVKIMARNPVFRENNNTLRSRFRHHQKFKVFSNWFEEQLG